MFVYFLQFVFACLVAFAAAGAVSTYTPLAYSGGYYASPYAYGAYPYTTSTFHGNYKPVAYSGAYAAPYAAYTGAYNADYTGAYKPLAYSAYNGYYGGYPYNSYYY